MIQFTILSLGFRNLNLFQDLGWTYQGFVSDLHPSLRPSADPVIVATRRTGYGASPTSLGSSSGSRLGCRLNKRIIIKKQ